MTTLIDPYKPVPAPIDVLQRRKGESLNAHGDRRWRQVVLAAVIAAAMCLTVQLMPGCGQPPKDGETVHSPAQPLQQGREELATVAEKWAASTDAIEKHATAGQSKTPASARAVLAPSWFGILAEAVKMREQQDRLKSVNSVQIEQAMKLAGALQADRDKWKKAAGDREKEIEKLRSNETRAFQRRLYSAAALCLLAIFLGVAGSRFPGMKDLGIGTAVAGAVTLAVAVGVAQFVAVLAHAMIAMDIVFIGTAVVIVAALAWAVIRYFRSTRENVQLLEAGKMRMSDQQRVELFGNGPDMTDSLAWNFQHPRTQTIVRGVRARLPAKAPPVESKKQRAA